MGKRVTIRQNKNGTKTKTTSYSYKTPFGTRKTRTYVQNVKKKGCYVATSVYGSYDCPEVWTLRRFRDYKLAKSIIGRLFIRIYYAISPTAVRLFGENKWFKFMFKGTLDKIVAKLNAKGFDSSPYKDKDW